MRGFLSSLGAGNPRRLGLLAICALGVAWGLIMHSMGWAQAAHFGEVRALAAGQANIDRWHWEGGDNAWIDGHFYSVKAPGLAAVTLPAYLGIEALGGKEIARDAARNARDATVPNWKPFSNPPHESHAYSRKLELDTERRTEAASPIVWALTLFGAVIPAVALLLLVRWMGDRIEPGYGTAAAVTLGLATIVMTFAAEYFSHVIATLCAFAAFVVLFREREGPPRLSAMAIAGLLAGLAVSFEYPLGLVGVIVFFYGLTLGRKLPRAAVYAAGALIGALPIFLFNLWAFGDPLHLAYSDAVETQGFSGHAVVGLNDDGFFGITLPRPDSAVDLLFAGRGLLTLTPVLLMGLVGTVMMRRGDHRAEANVILAVTLTYFVYNAGYWLPFGGGSPGPRFLVPALPFLALGLATAYRRAPAVTLGLAIPSAICMLVGTLTYPLIGDHGIATWVQQLRGGDIEHTLFTVLGVEDSRLAVLPVLLAVGVAIAAAAAATPRRELGSIRNAVIAIAVWAVVFTFGPSIAGDEVDSFSYGGDALQLLAVGAVAALATLFILRRRERRNARQSTAGGGVPEPALETGSIS